MISCQLLIVAVYYRWSSCGQRFLLACLYPLFTLLLPWLLFVLASPLLPSPIFPLVSFCLAGLLCCGFLLMACVSLDWE
ncbi:hypothetical protein BJ508DRAFT_84997 [Ascobolus immersus RN42]|uniref:Uncharacterized protein n=1 Tax=Ascobolus immersus RN42 TaxID=1160509 RepID=A0A3N4HBM3_ASCIM|nr:hypothetical protein BJ508DRAFT_84997 [Ascobolus immersus RN42]